MIEPIASSMFPLAYQCFFRYCLKSQLYCLKLRHCWKSRGAHEQVFYYNTIIAVNCYFSQLQLPHCQNPMQDTGDPVTSAIGTILIQLIKKVTRCLTFNCVRQLEIKSKKNAMTLHLHPLNQPIPVRLRRGTVEHALNSSQLHRLVGNHVPRRPNLP